MTVAGNIVCMTLCTSLGHIASQRLFWLLFFWSSAFLTLQTQLFSTFKKFAILELSCPASIATNKLLFSTIVVLKIHFLKPFLKKMNHKQNFKTPTKKDKQILSCRLQAVCLNLIVKYHVYPILTT